MIPIGHYDRDDTMIDATESDGIRRFAVMRPSSPCVVMGRGSKLELEVNDDTCAALGIPILRRRGGGCSVLLDPGQLVVALAIRAEGIGDNDRHFREITRWMIHALDRSGVSGVTQQGISDLTLGDKKIGGSCIYRRKGLLYYSTTLLVEPDMKLMESVLKHPPREPEYRARRTHRDFCGTIGIQGSIEDFRAHLETNLA